MIPLIIIILVIVIVIAAGFSWYRIRKKLETDKELEEAEKQSYEQEYRDLYSEDISRPKPGELPFTRTGEIPSYTPSDKDKEPSKVEEPPRMEAEAKVPSQPAGPMRYGYKMKKVEPKIPVRAPPKPKGERIKKQVKKQKEPSGKAPAKEHKKPPKKPHKVEWD